MNKRQKVKIPLIFFCALVLCTSFALIFSFAKHDVVAKSTTTSCYDIMLEYDGNNTLNAQQELLFEVENEQGLTSLVFHLYANAFSAQNGGIDILSVKIDRQTVDFEIYGSDNTLLKIPCNLACGDVCVVAFEYIVRVPSLSSRLGKTSDGTLNLTHFYPVLSRYENGWREDEYSSVGDPFYSDISSFYVSLTCDKNLLIATSGDVQIEQYEQKQTAYITAENIRDFGMVIGNTHQKNESIDIGDRQVLLRYFFNDDANADKTLQRMKDSLSVFSSVFGDYPYGVFTLSQSNLADAGGMEYGAFAIVSPTQSHSDYLEVVTHEIAHQWWYNVVGNDQINSAWLDEGLSEFCTYYFHYATGEKDVFANCMANISTAYKDFSQFKHTVGFDGTMNRGLNTYLTNGEYVAVIYQKGAMLFELLHNIVGDKKFCNALSAYFEQNKFQIATANSLISAFKTQGYDISAIVNGFVNDKALV